MMRTCASCEAPNRPEVRFCTSCGAPLPDVPGHSTAPQEPAAPVAPPPAAPVQPPVRSHAPAFVLQTVAGPDPVRVLELRGESVLGRAPGCDLIVADQAISKRHARLTVAGDGVLVTDLGSTNGTTVDGRPVGGDPVLMRPEQRLELGDSVFVLRSAGG